jgi:predicted ATPase
MAASLRTIEIKGFRSLRDVRLEKLEPVTVLIGANGSGKSNLLSFLRLMPLLASGSLRRYVAEAGGAPSLLFDGPRPPGRCPSLPSSRRRVVRARTKPVSRSEAAKHSSSGRSVSGAACRE